VGGAYGVVEFRRIEFCSLVWAVCWTGQHPPSGGSLRETELGGACTGTLIRQSSLS